MLRELQKHNQLGDLDNILFVLQNALSKKLRLVTDIKKYCSDESVELVYAIDGILILLEFTGMISRAQESVKLNSNVSTNWIKTIDRLVLARIMTEKLFSKLKDESCLEEFIPLEKVRFDPTFNKISIQNNSIPLQYSSIKNLLIDLGAMIIDPEFPNILLIKTDLQPYFEGVVIPWLIEESEKSAYSSANTPMSIEKFQEIQELKNQYGAQAEEYVLQYERNRLIHHPMRESIRRISNIDISAGYDIVSFENQDSKVLDRFIEVKSFSRYPEFYWSRNEVRSAELKRNSYHLYLVDREQIGMKNYEPIVVQDPYLTVFQDTAWQREVQSWSVRPSSNVHLPKKDQSKKLFISYSHHDQVFVKKLASHLAEQGNIVWWDYSIRGGQEWDREIEKAINECHHFLVVLTPHAVDSKWVRQEILFAGNKGKNIIPLLLTDCEMPILIIEKQHISFVTQKHPAALKELTDLLKIYDPNSNEI
jgi:hypothetical protein